MEVSDRGGRRRGGAPSLEDCACPVCLEIFVEPVTLPCAHTFCKACFLESVDKAALCCPLCRKRVSTWARRNGRNNTLVDQQLWTQIQTRFPLQCQRRLSGQDAEDEPAVSVFVPRVSQPGELRQEYEDQVTKLTEEKRALEEEERRASEELIRRLLQEEEQLLQEEQRRREDDERLARLLSDQLNSAVPQENLRPDVTPAKKKKKEVSAGRIERFLSPRPSNSSSSTCSCAANKENVLVSLHNERLLPQLDLQGLRPESPDLHPTSLSTPVEEQLHLTADGGSSSTKRKVTEDEEVTLTKRACLPSCSVEPTVVQNGAEWETKLLSRRQQEEEDRRLALLLQKELDQEERQRATDRRKGSSDAYLLRQTRREKVTPRKTSTQSSAPKTSTPSSGPKTSTLSSAPKTSTPSSGPKTSTLSSGPKTSTLSSAPKTSTPSSGPSSSRGSKQATLTEMFSSLS